MKTLTTLIIAAVSATLFMTSCSDPSKDIYPEGPNGPGNPGGNVKEKPGKPTTDPGIGCEWIWDASDWEWEKSCGNTGDNSGGDSNRNNGENEGNKDDQNEQCNIRVSSTELPQAIRDQINKYSTSAPYYYIISVSVCKKGDSITRYTIEMGGPNSLTLHYNGDGSPIK